MNLGSTIKQIRSQKGIKQNTLADLSGISQTYLCQIEGNTKEPNISTLREIAKSLEVPLPVLFFLSLNDDDIHPDKLNTFKQVAPSIKSMISTFFDNVPNSK